MGERLGEENIAAIATFVWLRRIEEARAANGRRHGEWGGRTIAQEAALPMQADLKSAYRADLRKVGTPEA